MGGGGTKCLFCYKLTLSFFQIISKMPPRTHEECLKLVCAVCANLHGSKATRSVSDVDAALVRKHIFPSYKKDSIWFPQHYITFFSTFRFSSFNVKLGDFGLLWFTGFLKLLFLFGEFPIKFDRSYPCSMLL